MTTATQGQVAELAVAEKLGAQDYKVLDRNWKTKICEIDIVAQKGKVVYFVEVKYRLQSGQGSGLEYITPKKLNQLKFAARVWTQNYNWDGDYRIMGAEVSGPVYEHITLIEITE